MANSLINNCTKRFWSDVKKVKGGKVKLPSNVDGIAGDDHISAMFAEKYNRLYNSVPYNVNDMNCLQQSIDNQIESCCSCNKCYSSHIISVNDVSKAIQALKHGKTDGNFNQYSDHLLHGTHRLNVYISLMLMFQSMLNHGIVPSGLLTSTIIPIPKGKNKSLNVSSNYRGIALSSIIGKVFDRVILTNHWNVLKSSDMQFGFKPKHSTTQCTFVINEVMQYYNNNNSNAYICMLDATKAFDRVEYVKLFTLMLKKGICPLVARVLSMLYTNQSVNIKWGKCTSDPFGVTNGVKQGGILSPILFALYIDELFVRLRESGYGCHIGSLYMGCFGYADDAMLLSPSVGTLKFMLSIVDKYGEEFNVKFNPDKCKLLCYPNCTNNDFNGIYYNHVYIENVQNAMHVGNIIGPKLGNQDIDNITNTFISSVNYVISVFSCCYSYVKFHLFQLYCMPLYGAMLWDFSSVKVDHFLTQWRKCIRKIWRLPNTTHCVLLPIICNVVPVEIQLHRRFVKFMCSLSNSKNMYIQTCLSLVLGGSASKVCNSLNRMVYLYSLDKHQLSNMSKDACKTLVCSSSCDADLVTAGNIADLCYIRDTKSTAFSRDEISEMLEVLCTE